MWLQCERTATALHGVSNDQRTDFFISHSLCFLLLGVAGVRASRDADIPTSWLPLYDVAQF